MHLVMLFGPPAVGKMTVGRELSGLTGYPLFHTHLSIEPVLEIFRFGSPAFAQQLRRGVIEEAVAMGRPGLIFSYVWALDDPADRAYVDHLTEPVRTSGGRLDFVELYAAQDVRLAREGTPLRIEHKRSKRDVAASRQRLLAADADQRLNTDGDFCYPEQHLRLDNGQLAPAAAAAHIADRLGIRLPLDSPP